MVRLDQMPSNHWKNTERRIQNMNALRQPWPEASLCSQNDARVSHKDVWRCCGARQIKGRKIRVLSFFPHPKPPPACSATSCRALITHTEVPSTPPPPTVQSIKIVHLQPRRLNQLFSRALGRPLPIFDLDCPLRLHTRSVTRPILNVHTLICKSQHVFGQVLL